MLKASVSALLFLCSCVMDVQSNDGVHDPASCETETMFCNGLVDCPEDISCGVWWCHQLQADDPARGQAWGRCRLAPVPDGMPCNGGRGVCDDRSCNSADDAPRE